MTVSRSSPGPAPSGSAAGEPTGSIPLSRAPLQADVLGERARLTPDAPALVEVETGLRLSYGQLDARARACARTWTELLGLRKGERVAILAHNRVEYLEAFFAAGKTGIVLVTLGTRLTAAELEHIVRDSAPKALLYGDDFADRIERMRARLGQSAPVRNWIALDSGSAAEAPTAEPVPPAGSESSGSDGSDGSDGDGDGSDGSDGDPREDDSSRTWRYAELLARLGPDDGWRRTPCDADDLYCLLYTSGTTGRPKGVMIPHRMILWNGINTVCGWQLRADDSSPIFTPLYHAGGLTAFLVPLFLVGGTIVLHRGFDAAQVWRTIEQEGCTVVLGVPTIWKLLLEAPEFERVDLSRLRWLISGGAPLPRFLIDAYQERGVGFCQGFGMTEVGVNCFAMTLDDSVRKAGSIGKPMMYTEARLVDAEGRDVPIGEIGQLLLRGPHVCSGYWRRPPSEAANPDARGWFATGDQARQDEEGFFYIAGRSKDMIISGGVNVYPAEIEAVLLRHPAVSDAAVVGVPDSQWGESGVAFVVLREAPVEATGERQTGDADWALALGEFLGELLARYKLPKAFRFVDQLPRTAYGKVIKGELRDRYLDRTGRSEP